MVPWRSRSLVASNSTGPEPSAGLLDLIEQQPPWHSQSERRVAQAVLRGGSWAIHASMAATPRAAGVSDPSRVIRSARPSDCESFKDFQLRLAQSLRVRRAGHALGHAASAMPRWRSREALRLHHEQPRSGAALARPGRGPPGGRPARAGLAHRVLRPWRSRPPGARTQSRSSSSSGSRARARRQSPAVHVRRHARARRRGGSHLQHRPDRVGNRVRPPRARENGAPVIGIARPARSPLPALYRHHRGGDTPRTRTCTPPPSRASRVWSSSIPWPSAWRYVHDRPYITKLQHWRFFLCGPPSRPESRRRCLPATTRDGGESRPADRRPR